MAASTDILSRRGGRCEGGDVVAGSGSHGVRACDSYVPNLVARRTALRSIGCRRGYLAAGQSVGGRSTHECGASLGAGRAATAKIKVCGRSGRGRAMWLRPLFAFEPPTKRNFSFVFRRLSLARLFWNSHRPVTIVVGVGLGVPIKSLSTI